MTRWALTLLIACVPKEAPHPIASNVAVEVRLPSATTEGVTVECVVRVVQPPAVTVAMVLHNGSDHGIVTASTSPMHVVHVTGRTDELRVFHGPTENPSSDEIHLLLRDPSKFHVVAAGATDEVRGGFTMRPSANGVFFEPGDSANDFLPLGCALSYWEEADWSPEHIQGGRTALSATIEFRHCAASA